MRNLKKVVALVAVFAMLVSSVAFGQTFSDVADDANYYEAIEMLNGLNILTGDDQDGDGVMDFRPEDTITRAEVAAVISRIQGINSAAQTDTVFTDVTASHWASGYVAQAAGQGIVNGYGDGTFGPENPVLYEQAVKMIVETLGYAPFVEENGGYYAGHMTAASRYGVLEGVIGGTIGKEATRGQVAQMLYNAVDTALMERAAYGDEANYVIYDGINRTYNTLLKRDLKVKKFEGVVKENILTALDGGNTPDTSKDETVDIDILNATTLGHVNCNYEADKITTWLVGESDVADYIGMEVTGYAKATGISGRYEIIAVAPTSLNDVTSFTLDNFASYDGSTKVEYYTDKDNGIKTTVKLEANNIPVIYNGTALNVDVNGDTAKDVKDVFAVNVGDTALVTTNSKFSGEVIFIDNDTVAGADVIVVNLAVPGVVDEVNAKGKITFKSSMTNPAGGAIGRIVLDDEDTAQIVSITKNGEAIDYSELKEWDVVSAIWTPDNNKVVALEVLESTVVEGKVTASKTSPTSKNNTAFVIDGVEYDVAVNAYEPSAIRLGSAGLFYVDAYGKIVAYNKNGTTSASDNYAYVLAAAALKDDWNNNNIKLQILAKDGNVYEAFLAQEVEIANYATVLTESGPDGNGEYTVTEFSGNYAEDTDIFEIENFAGATDGDGLKAGTKALAAKLQNTLITYEANSAGEIDAIGVATMVANDAEDNGWLFKATADDATAAANAYDEEDKELTIGSTTVNVTDDTIVFFVNGASALTGVGAPGIVASKTASRVSGASAIGQIPTGNEVSIYDVDDNDDAAVIVIYDMIGGISASTNIAVLAGPVGQAVVDGDKVVAVEFFMGGEKKTAYVEKNATGDSLTGASFGDVFKFAFNADGTAITAVRKCFDFTDRAYATGKATVTNLDTFIGGAAADVAHEGYAIKYNSSNKRIAYATGAVTLDHTACAPNASHDCNGGATPCEGVYVDNTNLAVEAGTIKVGNANVYVYEPSKITNKVYVGDASDINVEEDVIKKTGLQKITNSDGEIVGTSDSVVGLLDYVVAFEYDNDVIDVVIYKPADFGVYNVQ